MSFAHGFFALVLVGFLGPWCRGATPPPVLVSSGPGFLFVEGEPVEVALERSGPARETAFQYEVRDTETAWHAQGEGKLSKLREGERQRVAFTLALPERGLYRLHVSGKSGQSFSLETTVALTFAPRPPDSASPWGIFYVPPVWFEPDDAAGPERAAASLRRLGASWVRLNFWSTAMDPVMVAGGADGPVVTPELKRWKRYAAALHREGLRVMGEIAQTPRALSSDPTNEQTLGDGGPAYNRSKPADYGLWEQLMEKVAREFREEIDVWEVWNEPDNQGVYWRGSPDELVELVRHTAAGLRRGHPQARIAGCGFTSSPAGRFFAEAALRAGLAKELDVFSFHYSDLHPGEIDRWRELLKEHGRNLPLWNTEERTLIPVFDRQQGIERTCKFLHVAIGYEDSEPLVEKNYTVRPAGLTFAVGARLIGSAKYVRTETVAAGSVRIFDGAEGAIGVFQAEPLARFLAGTKPPASAFTLAPPESSPPLSVTTSTGKTKTLAPSGPEKRVAVSTVEPLLFLNGWPLLQIDPVSPAELGRFEIEAGHFGPQWRRVAARDASGQAVLEADPNAPAGSSAEVWVDFTVARPGEYELLLAAQTAPVNGSADTAFAWALDAGGAESLVSLPAPLPGGEAAGVRLLRRVKLAVGAHRFRLAPAPPAAVAPAALKLDALAVRLISPLSGSMPTKKD